MKVLDLAKGLLGGTLTVQQLISNVQGAESPESAVLKLLKEALDGKCADDVEYAMIIGYRLGFTPIHIGVLSALAFEDWHFKHEDVVTALGKTKDSRSIEALVHLANHVPDYLSFDESRALAVKAIWALFAIGGDRATSELEILKKSAKDIVIKDAAKERLLCLKTIS